MDKLDDKTKWRLYEINQKYFEKKLLNEDDKKALQSYIDLSHENLRMKWMFGNSVFLQIIRIFRRNMY